MILAFDTETSGLPMFRDPSDHPDQPHLLQIAAILCDFDGKELAQLSTIVKPGAGCIIHPKALEAHGITLERAQDEGADPQEVFRSFDALAGQASLIVGHNVPFDIRIARIHSARHFGVKWDNPLPTFCTMRRSDRFTNLPPTDAMMAAGRHHSKAPTLTEAYRHFFGEEFDGAHDALNDVKASLRIFHHLTKVLNVPMFAVRSAA